MKYFSQDGGWKEAPRIEHGLVAVPCALYRGGTSKGPVFLASDLPADRVLRNQLILAALNPDHPGQIDGVGGAETLSNKVVIVSPSREPGADVDYKFIQLTPGSTVVRDDCGTSGNMAAAVGPFALERGLVRTNGDETKVRIFAVDSRMLISAKVRSPDGEVTYRGETAIAGISHAAAPVVLTYRAPFGNLTGTGAPTPTGNRREVIDGVPVTVIDAGGALAMIFRADAVGRTGYESKAALDADEALAVRMEPIRREAGRRLGLREAFVDDALGTMMIAPARDGGSISSRKLSTLADAPARCHAAHSGSGAVCLAIAAMLPGTVAAEISTAGPGGGQREFGIEHPSGIMSVVVETEGSGAGTSVSGVSLLRTSRKLFDGTLYVPADVLR
ncbi:PrpF domain-containing protein [Chelativorans xinjiangense]|uniref:PrpF domain-containing protein n=1 Tax=Chelativorans xinjiangense TaxID=2681485 RepID=UPI0013598A56|nr:PrpF domain-containing protein [Chelativorans xinjiangense]